MRLLEERPEWRREIRRLVLTDELLSLPEQVASLRAATGQRFQELIQQVAELADAQKRTEGEMTELAALGSSPTEAPFCRSRLLFHFLNDLRKCSQW